VPSNYDVNYITVLVVSRVLLDSGQRVALRWMTWPSTTSIMPAAIHTLDRLLPESMLKRPAIKRVPPVTPVANSMSFHLVVFMECSYRASLGYIRGTEVFGVAQEEVRHLFWALLRVNQNHDADAEG
jgi:hypothetical protein